MDFLIMAAIALGVDVLVDNVSVLRELTHQKAIAESTDRLTSKVAELLSDREALEAFIKGAKKEVVED